MFITSKDMRRTNAMHGRIDRPQLQDAVDALFNTENLDNIELPNIEYVHYNLIRTKTTIAEDNYHFPGEITEAALNIACGNIIGICNRHPHPEEEYYHFRIPKKTGGFRPIDAPEKELKKDMKEIAHIITNELKILVHDSAWAYVPGRDVVHCMKEHQANESRWYLKIDLKNFFGSCNPDFIYRQLQKIYPFANNLSNPYVLPMLSKLVDISCYQGGLPQGTPLSPLITNLIMVEYDYLINALIGNLVHDNKIHRQRYIYTRYADDIIISAKNHFEYKKLVKELKKLFRETEAPFTVNDEKTRFGNNSGRNWNLGVMCNKDNNITIGHKRKQEIKAAVHSYINSNNEWELQDLQYLLGQLSWLNNVEPNYFEQLMQYFIRKYNVNVWQSIIDDIKRR